MPPFKLEAPFKPCGDQGQAIEKLSSGILAGKQHQALLGVTGSGKTFTMANVVERVQKPTLVLVHNKTLAGQLYQDCLLYTSPSPRDRTRSRMPSSA